MQESPTPNPSDDTSASEGPDGRKRLKLRRLGGEEARAESPPAAKKEEPPPQGEGTRTGALEPEQPAERPPEADAADSGDFGDDLIIKPREGKPARSPLRRLAFLLIPGLIIAGILVFLIRSMDPFGGDLAPIKPDEAAVGEQEVEAPPAPALESVRQLDMDAVSPDGVDPDIGSFLKIMSEQTLVASRSPRGLFINTVFYPEGAVINPALELTFQELATEDGPVAILAGPGDSRYELPLELRK